MPTLPREEHLPERPFPELRDDLEIAHAPRERRSGKLRPVRRMGHRYGAVARHSLGQCTHPAPRTAWIRITSVLQKGPAPSPALSFGRDKHPPRQPYFLTSAARASPPKASPVSTSRGEVGRDRRVEQVLHTGRRDRVLPQIEFHEVRPELRRRDVPHGLVPDVAPGQVERAQRPASDSDRDKRLRRARRVGCGSGSAGAVRSDGRTGAVLLLSSPSPRRISTPVSARSRNVSGTLSASARSPLPPSGSLCRCNSKRSIPTGPENSRRT